MYRNQYLITRQPIQFHTNLEQFTFGDFSVLVHHELKRHYARSPTSEVLLLGFAFSPNEPEKSADTIVSEIASQGHIEGVFLTLQALSGRYVVLLSIAAKYFAIPDACASKHLYYSFQDDNIVLTSSPKLFLDAFNLDPRIDAEKQQLINNEAFQKHESSWFGDEHYDCRLKKVLPNHYLEIKSQQIFRRPIFVPDYSDYQSVLRSTATTLQGTFSSVLRYHSIIQPVTAGLDSRILLAASKAFKSRIKYYIFRLNEEDERIAVRLADRLKLDFEVIDPENLRNEFLSIYANEHVVPRFIPRTTHIQYHYVNHRTTPNLVNMSGSATEIVRCRLGVKGSSLPDDLFIYMSHLPNNSYVRRKINEWLQDAAPYSKVYGLPLLDLFYWEQRIGNWGALNCHEKDLGVEEVWPFNNLNLILQLLRVDPLKRKWPSYKLFKDLIAMMWPEALDEEINPSSSDGLHYVKEFIKMRPQLRYLAFKIKNFI